jgi:oligopeptide transport system substrate-binding protein
VPVGTNKIKPATEREETAKVQRRALFSTFFAGLLTPLVLACGHDPHGGTVRIRMPLPDRLDPGTVESDLDAQLAAHVYSGLTTLNPEGEPIPDLAQRWSISSDGRTYRFPLRQNIRFHNGESLTADSIKVSWQRVLNPKFESPAALRFLGKIAGIARYRNGLDNEISGLRAIDERTLEVELSETDLAFPAKATHPVTYVMPPPVTGADMTLGSGPFAVVDWKPGEALTLARNEEYYGFEPHLDRIEITDNANADSLDLYLEDALDVLYIGANDIPTVLDRNNPLNRDLNIESGLDTTFLAMNNRLPPFDDEKVRQAFALAIDRAAIADQVFSQTVGKATSLLPPSLALTDDSPAADFDVFKARQALADSRYRDASNLPEVTFTVPGTRGSAPPQILALISMFQQHLGVSVRVERVPWADFVGNLDQRGNPYQLFLFSWHADYPDPQAVLDPLFRSTSLSNYSDYLNQEVEALLVEARGETNSDRRQETFNSIEQIVSSEVPVTPLWNSKSYVLIKPWLRDVQLSANARPWLNRVYLDS